jgi:spore coat polysaccharide biosynthesis protein SpsF
MGSTRFPKKVLLLAVGKPLLELLVERLSFCTTLDRLIVATSTDERDTPIAELCAAIGVPVFRGSEHDVLDRYVQASREYGLDVIVRITADCPLIDPALVDEMVRFFLEHEGEYDLVTNRHPLTFPDGLDVDVMAMSGLEHAWRHATEPHQREHTIPYFWDSGMRIFNFEDAENGFFHHRWTLDYPEDYELIRQVFEALYCKGTLFTTKEILDFLAMHPEISRLNACYLPIHA